MHSTTSPRSWTAKREQRWEALRQRLEAKRPCLAKQGSLVTKTVKGKPFVVLRFTVEEKRRKVLKSMHIAPTADAEMIRRVQDLLEDFRESAAVAKELAWLARLAGLAKSIVRRQRRRLTSRR